MKKIKVHDKYLAEKIEESIKEICFVIVDKKEFSADMMDEYYEKIKKELSNIIEKSGYTQYDYIVEDI